MISDVLSDAVVAMQEYLDHDGTKDCYQGDVRKRIEALMEQMTAMRVELDTPPWMIVPGTLAGDVTQRQLDVADERTKRAFVEAERRVFVGELSDRSSMFDLPLDEFVDEFAPRLSLDWSKNPDEGGE